MSLTKGTLYYAVLVKQCCVHSFALFPKFTLSILHQRRLIVKSEIFVFRGRIFRISLSLLSVVVYRQILLNFVETFLGIISTICIAFTFALCYHIFTQCIARNLFIVTPQLSLGHFPKVMTNIPCGTGQSRSLARRKDFFYEEHD